MSDNRAVPAAQTDTSAVPEVPASADAVPATAAQAPAAADVEAETAAASAATLSAAAATNTSSTTATPTVTATAALVTTLVAAAPPKTTDPAINTAPTTTDATILAPAVAATHDAAQTAYQDAVAAVDETHVVIVPAATGSMPMQGHHPSAAAPASGVMAAENKWSKNGYGMPCAPPASGGKFSPEETATVRAAIKEYCAAKNITTARLCSECDHKAELKGAWMAIAQRLPHRTVQAVYRHGLRQLHPFRRGPWTDEECKTLVDLVAKMGKKWSAIQSKLSRSADSCRDKYREMSKDYIRGRWKEGETEILKRLVREHLRVDPNADVKELAKMVSREGIVIPWSIISKRMGKRSRLSCFKKWQKLTGQDETGSGSGRGNKRGPPRKRQRTVPQPSSAPTAGAAAAAAAYAKAHANTANTTSVAPAPSTETVANIMVESSTATVAAQASAEHVTSTTLAEYDLALLSSLATSSAVRPVDIDWNSLKHPTGDARARWQTILDGLPESFGGMLGIPLSDLARLLLERTKDAKKQVGAVDVVPTKNPVCAAEEEAAKMAAETVEAVDLPPIGRLK